MSAPNTCSLGCSRKEKERPRDTCATAACNSTRSAKASNATSGAAKPRCTANNLAEVLDFGHPKLTAPAFAVPPSPTGVPCPAGALLPSGQPVPLGEEEDEWAGLRLTARDDGWPL